MNDFTLTHLPVDSPGSIGNDDDIVIAGGLTLQAGLQAGAQIHCRIATDGPGGGTPGKLNGRGPIRDFSG